VIRSFNDRDTAALFRSEPVRKFGPDLQRAALRKLLILDAAVTLDNLRVPPGNRLEALRGNRTGQHSIRINDQWRICFVWKDGDAHRVEIVDYH
jgi:proteic killer suppression protein